MAARRRTPPARARAVVTLRAYRAEDEDAVVALWWSSWHSIRPGLRHPLPLAGWRTRWTDDIASTHHVVVAEAGSAVVGFAAAAVSARELGQIFVDPRRQGEGIGTQLLTWAKQVMPDGFSLHTLTDNRGARVFYERHGLIAGGTRINPVNGMETVEYAWRPAPPAPGVG